MIASERPSDSRPVSVLDTLGVPVKEGRLDWPLGLRILPPSAETAALRQQIEALLQAAASQSVAGHVRSGTLVKAALAVDRLHRLLRRERAAITSTYTYLEADRFLTRLASGLKMLP
jgi:hypothetical protein